MWARGRVRSWKKKGLQEVLPETAPKIDFLTRNVARNRAAVEANKNCKMEQEKTRKNQNIKKNIKVEKKNLWIQKLTFEVIG